jgi:hypothetical protein
LRERVEALYSAPVRAFAWTFQMQVIIKTV